MRREEEDKGKNGYGIKRVRESGLWFIRGEKEC